MIKLSMKNDVGTNEMEGGLNLYTRSICPKSNMEVFGQESKEELVFEPATLKVIERVRPKYTCRHCETVKTAKAVELPLPKSKAGSALIAEVMMNKYAYHLPFYRQSKMFAMHGLSIPDNTLAGWVMQAAEALAPLQRAFFEQLGKVHALQADETPVKILQPEKKAYMWLYHSTVPYRTNASCCLTLTCLELPLW